MLTGQIFKKAHHQHLQVHYRIDAGPSVSLFLSSLARILTDFSTHGNSACTFWQEVPAQAAQLSAHGLAPQDPKESGIFASLPPGAFTAILPGRNGGTGIGLVEIYNLK